MVFRVGFPAFGIPTSTYQLVSSADSDVVAVVRPPIRTALGTTFTVIVPLVNPGADTVTTALPVTFSSPCTWNGTFVTPFATLTTIDAAPAVVPLGATSTRVGSLLV